MHHTCAQDLCKPHSFLELSDWLWQCECIQRTWIEASLSHYVREEWQVPDRVQTPSSLSKTSPKWVRNLFILGQVFMNTILAYLWTNSDLKVSSTRKALQRSCHLQMIPSKIICFMSICWSENRSVFVSKTFQTSSNVAIHWKRESFSFVLWWLPMHLLNWNSQTSLCETVTKSNVLENVITLYLNNPAQ